MSPRDFHRGGVEEGRPPTEAEYEAALEAARKADADAAAERARTGNTGGIY